MLKYEQPPVKHLYYSKVKKRIEKATRRATLSLTCNSMLFQALVIFTHVFFQLNRGIKDFLKYVPNLTQPP